MALEYLLQAPESNFRISSNYDCGTLCQTDGAKQGICRLYPLLVLRGALILTSSSDERFQSWYSTTTDSINDICGIWYGVECYPANLAVNFPIEIRLSGVGLVGTIPAELSHFEYLEVLDLSDNAGLDGVLPYQLGRLPELTSLKVHNTGLSGSLPPELATLEKLTLLDISYTSITGSVPLQWGSLVALREFFLYNTSLAGTMPEQVCRLTEGNLSTLDADCSVPEIECNCCTTCY